MQHTPIHFFNQNQSQAGLGSCLRTFKYASQNNLVDDYYVSCNSQDFDAAMTATNPNQLTILSVAAGSGYNTVG